MGKRAGDPLISRRTVLRAGALLFAAGAAGTGCAPAWETAGTPVLSGATAWTHPVAGTLLRGLRFADATVVSWTMETVTALNAVDGRQLWQLPLFTGSVTHQTAITEYTFYTCGQESESTPERALGLDVRSGQRKWSFDAPEGIVLNGAYGALAGAVFLVVYEQSTQQRQVWAVEAAGGAVRWRVPCPTENTAVHVPASGTLVYNLGRDGEILALDTATGATVWSRAATPWTVTTLSSGFVGGSVLMSDRSTTMWGLDPATGASVWQANVELDQGVRVFAAADRYFVSDGTRLRAYRPGSEASALWEAQVDPNGDAVNVGGITDTKTFYLVADTLRAMDTDTGRVRWTYQLPEHATGMDVRVAVGDRHCYVGIDSIANGSSSSVVALNV